MPGSVYRRSLCALRLICAAVYSCALLDPHGDPGFSGVDRAHSARRRNVEANSWTTMDELARTPVWNMSTSGNLSIQDLAVAQLQPSCRLYP